MQREPGRTGNYYDPVFLAEAGGPGLPGENSLADQLKNNPFLNSNSMKKGTTIYWSLIGLLIAAGIYVNFLSSVSAVPLAKKIDSFPTRIGSFQKVREISFSKAVVDNAGVDQYLMWYYQDRDGYTLALYIGYYEYQAEGHIIHSPQHCMPASGWEFKDEEKIAVTNPATGRPAFINRAVLQKGMEKQVAHFWYQGRGRIIGNEYKDRALLILDSIVKHQSQGALVRITGPASDPAAAIGKQMQFIKALLPVLNEFIPN